MDDWRRLNSFPLHFNYKMRKADHQIISNYIVYLIFSHFVYSFINILMPQKANTETTFISECLIYFRNIIL